MATDAARYLGFLRQDVSHPISNSAGDLRFELEICSPRPTQIPQYITASAGDLTPFGFTLAPAATAADRREQLYLWLAERVLTFACEQDRAIDLAVYPFDTASGDIWSYECLPVLAPEPAVAVALRSGRPVPGLWLPERGSPEVPHIVLLGDTFCGPFPAATPANGGVSLRAEFAGPGQLPARADGLRLIADRGCWFVESGRYAELVGQLRAATAAPHLDGSTAAPYSEKAFLQRLQAEAAAEGLYFRDGELLAFHTALKTGSLVVLAGLSGTGKSHLMEVYRRALGLPVDTNFLWLSVRPSWDDDADLIGFYDPLNRLYRAGETGLVDLLLRAAHQPEQLFLVCFDEMNLARVEHYFAQFLSNLERPAASRCLRLYAPELTPDVYNSAQYPAAIPIGDNVLFCGTINVDESTHAFSDKVLDRCNLMHMRHVDIRRWWELTCAQAGAAAPAAAAPTVSADLWRYWCTPLDPHPYEPVIDFLQRLNEVLAAAGPDQRFGYRVVHQILLYLHRIPRDETGQPLVLPAHALDQQVAQRILTKVRGASEDLLELFQPDGPLLALLDATALGPFQHSRTEIARKHRELVRHEFTS